MDYELAALLAHLPPEERAKFVKDERERDQRLSDEQRAQEQAVRRVVRRATNEALFEGVS